MGRRERRDIIRSHESDGIQGPVKMDGYACPLDFCSIKDAEGLFRDASHYLYTVTKNIESQKSIAAEIGEKVFYNDNELYAVASRIASNISKQGNPALLDKDNKINTAKTLHYEYNAGNKQIARMLKLDISIVDALFTG